MVTLADPAQGASTPKEALGASARPATTENPTLMAAPTPMNAPEIRAEGTRSAATPTAVSDAAAPLDFAETASRIVLVSFFFKDARLTHTRPGLRTRRNV